MRDRGVKMAKDLKKEFEETVTKVIAEKIKEIDGLRVLLRESPENEGLRAIWKILDRTITELKKLRDAK